MYPRYFSSDVQRSCRSTRLLHLLASATTKAKVNECKNLFGHSDNLFAGIPVTIDMAPRQYGCYYY